MPELYQPYLHHLGSPVLVYPDGERDFFETRQDDVFLTLLSLGKTSKRELTNLYGNDEAYQNARRAAKKRIGGDLAETPYGHLIAPYPSDALDLNTQHLETLSDAECLEVLQRLDGDFSQGWYFDDMPPDMAEYFTDQRKLKHDAYILGGERVNEVFRKTYSLTGSKQGCDTVTLLAERGMRLETHRYEEAPVETFMKTRTHVGDCSFSIDCYTRFVERFNAYFNADNEQYEFHPPSENLQELCRQAKGDPEKIHDAVTRITLRSWQKKKR